MYRDGLIKYYNYYSVLAPKQILTNPTLYYFQLLEKRIENFVYTSKNNICTIYPDTEQFVKDEVQKLKNRWEDFKQRTHNTRKSIDLTIEYFTLGDTVSKTHRYFYFIFFMIIFFRSLRLTITHINRFFFTYTFRLNALIVITAHIY